MKSKIVKQSSGRAPGCRRSVVVGGRKTTISLEEPFWKALRQIATARNTTLSDLLAAIRSTRKPGYNLSSAVRVFVLDSYRAQISAGTPSITSMSTWAW